VHAEADIFERRFGSAITSLLECLQKRNLNPARSVTESSPTMVAVVGACRSEAKAAIRFSLQAKVAFSI
jgi:hypothetical protein